MKRRKRLVSLLLCLVLACNLQSSCFALPSALFWRLDQFVAGYKVDYANTNNWVYYGYGADQAVDVFFVAPTVQEGSSYQHSLDIYNTEARNLFKSAVNLEWGIYADSCRFYAPYYRQVTFATYSMTDQTAAQTYYDLAYQDVRSAFLYYLTYYNQGRPFILAGFSQGAENCLRLLSEFFDDEALQSQLVACYAIGWPVTADFLAENPWINMAQGESDTGVVISFNSEAMYIQSSTLVPAGTKALGINPLNWKTDSTYAPASMNLGACFCDPSTGAVREEYTAFTGAYLDPTRGTLKVTDADPNTYTAYLNNNADGVFHIYDFIFFYRNLQKNVATRTAAYLAGS
jgi:hypothetical protein